MMKQWVDHAGLGDKGYTLHSLRHGAATRWLNSGLNVRDVQELLGHAQLNTTATYLHTDPSRIAAEMEQKLPPVRAAAHNDS